MKLDIACGQNKREGFTGIDIAAAPGVDIVHDLMEFPWPIKDGEVEEAHCSHFIEHIPHRAFGDKGPDPFLMFFDELYRVMKPGATAFIIAPYYSSIRCWQDPTHTRAISDMTFYYLNEGWRKSNKLDHYPVKCDFDFVLSYDFPTVPWASKSEEARMFAFTHYANTINDIRAVLTKRPASP